MKVGIIGLGLIGGSLGLDLRARGMHVIGISRRESTCQRALEKGVVDEASVDFAILATAELIVLCTPIGAIATTLKAILPYVRPETIITDVGSVKVAIVRQCSQLWPNFVGGHPMAGNTEQGIEAAQTDLFIGAAYVLTPTEQTPPDAVERVAEIASTLGSHLHICTPEAHDHAVALISHLPVMVSAALIDTCMSQSQKEVLELAQQLASSGFRDTSRVGGGNPELGLMMAEYNRPELLSALSQYRDRLDRIIDAIDSENWSALEQLLTSTTEARPKFL